MVRPIRETDREAYLAMAKAFYQSDAVAHSVPEQHFQDTFAEMMRSSVYAEGYFLEQDGWTAGYALLAKTFSQEAGGLTVWVEELYVKPEFRGKGLGTAFFQFLRERYPEARRFRLEAEPENERAMALYRRMGFEPLEYLQMILDKN